MAVDVSALPVPDGSATRVTPEDIRAAADLIAPYLIRTPTVPFARLTERLGVPVVAKLELLQHTGAFKARGAFHRLLHLDAAEREAGVVAVSGGNHGLAVAYAARQLGISATLLMPTTAAATSIEQARADGAQVILTESLAEAFDQAVNQVTLGRVMIHPFDDPLVIAGQGTLAHELLEDAPETTDVILSIGGGGLFTGAATALKALKPEIRVWGVETEGADAMSQAFAAGHPVTLDAIRSIATTLGAPSVSQRTYAATRALAEAVITVSDADTVRAIETLAQVTKLVTEPAAACTWAAALKIRDRLPVDAQVALVLCGGNASLDDIARWRHDFPVTVPAWVGP